MKAGKHRILFLTAALWIPAVIPALLMAEEAAPDRHYFERCTTSAIAELKQGVTREEARKACRGFEFPAAESIRKGFVFAVDKKRSATVTIPGWLPAADQSIDFFCSKEIVVMVYYNKEGAAEYVTRFPMHQAPPSN